MSRGSVAEPPNCFTNLYHYPLFVITLTFRNICLYLGMFLFEKRYSFKGDTLGVLRKRENSCSILQIYLSLIPVLMTFSI